MRVGRVYDERTPEDGIRVLVDGIWPRGLTTEQADLDEWYKQVAPSTALRTWFGQDPNRFEEFGRRYRRELEDPGRADALEHLHELAQHQTLTLLTAAKHTEISKTILLAELLGAENGTG
ncbi:MAG: DUF488 domain-containing protein [Pseudonocardiaceae bacterium]